MVSTVKTLWQKINNTFDPSSRKSQEFLRKFERNLNNCQWKPHPLYSVFTQYDQEHYLRHEAAFLHKYRCFYAVSKTISPRKILELGTAAGSSADAYLSATPSASYVGFDSFGVDFNQAQQTVWDPREIATKLFESRGFQDYELIQIDLRTLERLPYKSDFVVVDAGHDFENEYADLKLALTADPQFIFVDDADGEDGAQVAIEKFLKEDVHNRVDFTAHIEYIGGGLVIKLKP
jgi:predicted O-methyltransferase YrrM